MGAIDDDAPLHRELARAGTNHYWWGDVEEIVASEVVLKHLRYSANTVFEP